MPTSSLWRVYDDWAKTYGRDCAIYEEIGELTEQLKGDVLSFKILGQRVIVLNSLEATQDLLEKRSSNYSDRPRWTMLEL